MTRSSVFRSWAILWAVLQFALPAGVTLADARVERESARAPRTHIESGTEASCHPSHPADCAFCQFLSRAAVASHSGDLPAIAVVEGHATDSHRGLRVTPRLARIGFPRAPPATLA